MTDEALARVKDVFLQACQLDGADRELFVEQACQDCPEVLREVLSLLDFHVADTVTGGLSDTGVPGGASSVLDEPEEAEVWVGRQLGKYRVTRMMDSGGMGTVLEAQDDDILRRVAIKVLHKQFAEDTSVRQRFLAEARAAGNLHHANVITIFEVAAEGERPYIVMEYASGGSAADPLAHGEAYALEKALSLTIQSCQGLAAAHRAGLVHRDVKPANLLLMGDGAVRVSDFGVAKALAVQNMQLTRQGQIVGTPHYMSPEQCEGNEVDARTDVYSLGATMYSLLVGTTPYAECKSLVSVFHSHCYAAPPDPREKVSQIPVGCANIIAKAMAKAPADRYQSMDEMHAALQQEMAACQGVLPYASASTQAPLLRRPRRSVLVASLLGAIVIAAATLFMLPRSDDNNPTARQPVSSRHRVLPGLKSGEPIKVGVLHSLTGTMSGSERGIVDACELAFGEINGNGGVLGHPIEWVLRDGKSDDSVFASQAESLITKEQVLTIFGCCTSSSRKAVKQVVEKHNHLLVYSVNHEGLEVSPNIIYLGCDPTQTVIPSVRWAFAFHSKRRFFLIGSDYVYPRAVNAMVKDVLEEMGAEVVGEAYLPLGDTHVRQLVNEIQELKPDAFINTISGDTQIAFLRSLRRQGINAMQISTGLGEEELRNLDPTLLVNDYAVATYFQSMPSQGNHAFLTRFQDKFGKSRVVNSAMHTAYSAVHMWAQSLTQAGELTPNAIRDSMLHQEYQAPGGLVRLDPSNHYAYRQCLIGRVKPDGQFDIVLQRPSLAAPEPFPRTRTREQWNMLLAQLQEKWNGAWAAPNAADN